MKFIIHSVTHARMAQREDTVNNGNPAMTHHKSDIKCEILTVSMRPASVAECVCVCVTVTVCDGENLSTFHCLQSRLVPGLRHKPRPLLSRLSQSRAGSKNTAFYPESAGSRAAAAAAFTGCCCCLSVLP